MTRRATVIGVVAVALVAVMGLIFMEIQSSASATVSGWVVTRDVSAGTVLGAGDVSRVTLRPSQDRFTITNDNPTGKRTSHLLTAQTLLAPDDFTTGDRVQVTVTVSGGAVPAGAKVDLFATVGGSTFLVGRHIPVAGVSGNSVTLLVPLDQEPLWVTVAANNKALTAVVAVGDVSPTSGGLTLDQALAQLGGSQPAVPASSGSVSPSPGVSP